MKLNGMCPYLIMDNLLEIRGLEVRFGDIAAVDGADLDIADGEILALVGESGSGKTVTALSITKILPEDARIAEGKILFKGRDLLQCREEELEEIRGKEISYIFQEAGASLNPVLPIGRQIQEAIILHQKKSRKEAADIAFTLLEMVKLRHPLDILKSYPHQLSGGMNQRVMIAIALAMKPKLLIADEPTTALDVTIESEIIRLLLELKKTLGFSILFITHNLRLVGKFADQVAIMYRGKIVEKAKTQDIFSNPKHKHTEDLINSIIRL